jgi:hypothetical protein
MKMSEVRFHRSECASNRQSSNMANSLSTILSISIVREQPAFQPHGLILAAPAPACRFTRPASVEGDAGPLLEGRGRRGIGFGGGRAR